jgi:thiamine-phosphate pyrophosphorylase
VTNDTVTTQLYLTAPRLADFDAAILRDVLAEGVACLMLDVSGFVEGEAGALEQMIAAADASECPLVLGGEDAMALDLAKRFAVDGVHLSGGPKQIEWARKQIGQDRIVGYDAGLSRHDAMVAAEAGADYVMLGPLKDVEPDLLTWWQAVIETPLVVDLGEADSENSLAAVAGITDFAMVSRGFSLENSVEFVKSLNAKLLS